MYSTVILIEIRINEIVYARKGNMSQIVIKPNGHRVIPYAFTDPLIILNIRPYNYMIHSKQPVPYTYLITIKFAMFGVWDSLAI